MIFVYVESTGEHYPPLILNYFISFVTKATEK